MVLLFWRELCWHFPLAKPQTTPRLTWYHNNAPVNKISWLRRLLLPSANPFRSQALTCIIFRTQHAVSFARHCPHMPKSILFHAAQLLRFNATDIWIMFDSQVWLLATKTVANRHMRERMSLLIESSRIEKQLLPQDPNLDLDSGKLTSIYSKLARWPTVIIRSLDTPSSIPQRVLHFWAKLSWNHHDEYAHKRLRHISRLAHS